MFDRLILFVTASPLRRFRNSQNAKRVEPVTIRTGIFPSRQEQYLAKGAAIFVLFCGIAAPLPCGAAMFHVYYLTFIIKY